MIGGIPLSDLTPPTLLGLGFLLLMTGGLFPRATVKSKDKEIERWREAYENERKARSLSDAQTTELLEVSKTNHALIQAIFANSERIRQSGVPDADIPKK